MSLPLWFVDAIVVRYPRATMLSERELNTNTRLAPILTHPIVKHPIVIAKCTTQQRLELAIAMMSFALLNSLILSLQLG